MGAGYALGTKRKPSAVFAIRPLSSLWAEAVALLLLLHYLLTLPASAIEPLLVFVAFYLYCKDQKPYRLSPQ
jgi:hypothetical protein